MFYHRDVLDYQSANLFAFAISFKNAESLKLYKNNIVLPFSKGNLGIRKILEKRKRDTHRTENQRKNINFDFLNMRALQRNLESL